MSKSQKTISPFSLTPSQKAPVKDIFSPGQLNEVLTAETGASIGGVLLNSQYPNLPPNRLAQLMGDKSLNRRLSKEGKTIDGVYKDMQRNLPAGIDLDKALGDVDIISALDTIGRLRNDMSPSAYGNMDTNMFGRMLKEVPAFTNILNSDNKYLENLKQLQFLDGNGYNVGGSQIGPFRRNSKDDALKYGFAIAMAENLLLGDGDGNGIIDMLADLSGMSESANVTMLKKVINIAALGGKIAVLVGLISNLGDKYKPRERRQTLRSLLQGYMLDRKVATKEYPRLGKELVDAANALEAGWYETTRNGEKVGYLNNFQYASYDALLVMQYDDRTAEQAIIASNTSVMSKSFRMMALNQYPYLYL